LRQILTALIICLTMATPARCGAWLREKDSGFSAVSATLRQRDQSYEYETSAYGEYGLLPNLTIGFDLNQTPGLTGHALVFARLPLAYDPDRGRIAFELGLGAQQFFGRWSPMQKFTLSYGGKITGRLGPGWLSIDLATELRSETPGAIYKLDATLGFNGPQLVQPLVTIETLKTTQAPLFWSVTPSLRITGQKDLSWLIGLEYRAAQARTTGLKISIWRSF
jgi:hypothetical protein